MTHYKNRMLPAQNKGVVLTKPHKAIGHRMLCLVSVLLTTLLLGNVPSSPFNAVNSAHAAANLVSLPDSDYGDCQFRVSSKGSSSEQWAPQLCWIDFDGIDVINDGGKHLFTKQIGNLTLSFAAQKTKNWPLDVLAQKNAWTGAVWGNTVSRQSNFIPQSGKERNKSVLKVQGPSGRWKKDYIYVEFTDIEVKDSNDKKLDNFDIAIADAESTNRRHESAGYHEMLTINSDGKVAKLLNITAPGRTQVCSEDGEHTFLLRNLWDKSDLWDLAGKHFDYYCKAGDKLKDPGAFLVGVHSPSWIQLGIFSKTDRVINNKKKADQALALALTIGRIGGKVKISPAGADTELEKLWTGHATSFDLQYGNKIGQVTNDATLETSTEGSAAAENFGTVLRSFEGQGEIPNPSDTFEFKSSAQGEDANLAFNRYTPEWTCQVGDRTYAPFSEQASVPTNVDSRTGNDFSIVNNEQLGTSTVSFPNKTNEPVYCQVHWKPRYEPATLKITKTVAGPDKADSAVANKQFAFPYTCRFPDDSASSSFAAAYPNDKLATGSVNPLSGQITVGPVSNYSGENSVAALAKGMECSVTETAESRDVQGIDSELSWDSTHVSVEDLQVAKITLGEGENALTATNTYEKKLVPVRVVNAKHGTYTGIPTDSVFNNQFSCTGKGITKDYPVTVDFTAASEQADPASDAAPTSGGVIAWLPKGAECTYTLSGSATNPSTTLEVTGSENPNRRPYSQLALWNGATKTSTVGGSLSDGSDVVDAMKDPTLPFTVPDNPPAVSGDASVMTLVTDTFYREAKFAPSFKKVATGDVQDGHEYSFTAKCGENDAFDFKLTSGGTRKFDPVPAGTQCTVTENVGQDETLPVVGVGSETFGADYRLDNVSVNQATASTGPQWTFTVNAVGSADDNAVDGAKWAVSATNVVPGIELKKEIQGRRFGNSGQVLLDDDQTEMTIKYSFKNLSTEKLVGVVLTDQSLAGLEVTGAGQTATIADDGTIPDTLCAVTSLDGEQTKECTLTVPITAQPGSFFSYQGPDAEVSAVPENAPAGAVNARVGDSASGGAVRLSTAVSQMLPQSGMQTLVLFLLLGLVILLFGLWRYLRRGDEDEEAQLA